MPDADYAQPPLFMRNHDRGRFRQVTEEWGPRLADCRSGRGVAAGDLDGDGDLDLVMTTMDGPLRVLINEGQRRNRAASIHLVGRPPNLEALGAVVEIEADGRIQIGVVRRGGSFLSASDVDLHFGLGSASIINRLSIRWPDGTSTGLKDLPAEARLTIKQGDTRVAIDPFPTRTSGTSRP